jgi:hypothetical protein
MLGERVSRIKVFILSVTISSAPIMSARAEPALIDQAMAAQETISRDERLKVSTTRRSPAQRRPCNVKRRVLTGAAVGFGVGIVAVQKAARENDGSVGVTGTLGAGAYGGAIGAFVGLMTCR